MFSLICVWINSWVNNREAGDLRRNRAHYDVIVMKPASYFIGIVAGDLFGNYLYQDIYKSNAQSSAIITWS